MQIRMVAGLVEVVEREETFAADIRSTYGPNTWPMFPADLSADRRRTSPAGRVDVTPCETEIGRLLYRHLEAAKTQLRGRLAKRNVLETHAALLEAAAEAPILAGGGDLVGFVASVDEFIQRISDMTHYKTDDHVTGEGF
jgi:hypothetical protein